MAARRGQEKYGGAKYGNTIDGWLIDEELPGRRDRFRNTRAFKTATEWGRVVIPARSGVKVTRLARLPARKKDEVLAIVARTTAGPCIAQA